nr:DUF4767 domain-containing protein [uncultured Streptococcus sp.]
MWRTLGSQTTRARAKTAVNTQTKPCHDVAFSDDGTGTADYIIVDSYGYSGSAMILYHFTIHKGQPVVLVSMQNQGNPENMYYMYPTNNKDIQEAFANIVNGK